MPCILGSGKWAGEGLRGTILSSQRLTLKSEFLSLAATPSPWRAVQLAAWDALTKADVAAA